MIRVTYRMGCHHHAYSQHFKASTIEQVTDMVDTKMLQEFFIIEVVGGYIRIYPSKVSAIEIRDVTTEMELRLPEKKEG